MRITRSAQKPLKIWMVTPELHRIKKTGGMADMVYGLSEGLLKRGQEVTAVMPKHIGSLEFFLRSGFSLSHLTSLDVPIGDKSLRTDVFDASFEHLGHTLNFLLVDTDKSSMFGNRNRPYGYGDDPYRFFFFDRAVYELYKVIGPEGISNKGRVIRRPDIIHGHDWQSGYTSFFLRQHPNSTKVPFVYNIHNLGYGYDKRIDLGEFSFLAQLPMDSRPELYTWDRGLEFYGQVDPHKAAFLFSDRVIAVSPQYVQEILSGETPPPADLYAGILQQIRQNLLGILNCLPDYFGPDYFLAEGVIPAAFKAEDLAPRSANKQALQELFDLPRDQNSLVMVWSSRIAEQKGIQVTIQSLSEMMKEVPGLQLIFIGDGEERWINELIAASEIFGKRLRYSPFSENQELLALAGGDGLIMPSVFEPCGLNQMKAQKLGNVPLVHATGGLIDTVKDGVTGFSFAGLTPENLVKKMLEMSAAFKNRELWTTIMRACLTQDYSWTTGAGAYEDIYRELVEQKPHTAK